MKRILTVMASAVVAVSAVANPIDETKAKVLAQEFLVPGHSMSLVKSATRNVAKARKVSGAVASTSPYYIYSRGEGKGFVIVAGDDCVPTILGYTEQGDWDETTVPDALRDMLQYYADYIEDAQVAGTNVAEDHNARIRKAAAAKHDIAPLVTSHWHQTEPYNNNCPTLTKDGSRALTGCVATAASQILYYWRKDLPHTLQASTPTYSYGDAPVKRSVPKGTPLKWELMKDSYSNEPAEYKDAVAEFVFATGAATWLTYGSSTSGNLEKIPATFSGYFGMNGGTVHYRESYSQTGWSNLLYGELEKGRPVMYTGVHPDNGGHAVFVHGYQASTDLFYFNFGWGAGNGYDGYYTTDTKTGMNGFYDYQSALIGAYPKSWNMNVDLISDGKYYAYGKKNVKVKVENNSTLPLSGLYLFVTTTKTKPSALTAAKASAADAYIESGSTQTFDFELPFNNPKTYYVTITDAGLNVLVQKEVVAKKADRDLTLNKVWANASSDVENVGGEDYAVIYNESKATMTLDITNNSDECYYGSMRAILYTSEDNGATWDEGTVKTVTGIEVPANSTANPSFNISTLNTGKLYKVVMERHVLFPLVDYDMALSSTATAADTVVRFILKEGGLVVDGYENRTIKCSGNWDVNAYNSTSVIRNSFKYKDHVAVDLTAVKGIVAIPDDTTNPNSLVYVAEDSKATGKNIIKAGKCENLVLTQGYDFAPVADFTAASAELTFKAVPGSWTMVTVPFDGVCPAGIVARSIDAHGLTGISNRTTDVDSLEAGKTYLVMTSSDGNVTIYGENANVSASLKVNNDTSVVGTYLNTTVPAKTFLLDDEATQFFVPVEEGTAVEAFTGYFHASNVSSKFRANSSITMDAAYQILANAISEARITLEECKGYVAYGAYDEFRKEIEDAEVAYSNRGVNGFDTTTAIKTYAQALLNKAREYSMNVAPTASYEVDFTTCIQNPSFESSASVVKGWTLGQTLTGALGTTSAKVAKNATNTVFTSGADGTYILNNFYAYNNPETGKKDSLSVEISQVVTGLVPGYYRLYAKVATGAGNTVTVYAGDSTATVGAHDFGVHYFTEAVVDSILVTAPEGMEWGELTIGIKGGKWYKADDFKLVYFATSLSKEQIDAISDVIYAENGNDKKGMFTIQGVRVASKIAPGLYIVDGKKVLVK